MRAVFGFTPRSDFTTISKANSMFRTIIDNYPEANDSTLKVSCYCTNDRGDFEPFEITKDSPDGFVKCGGLICIASDNMVTASELFSEFQRGVDSTICRGWEVEPNKMDTHGKRCGCSFSVSKISD